VPRRHGAWTQLLAAGQHLGSQHFSSRAADMAQILACVAATCPGVAQIDVEGCSEEAQLRALAVPLRRANFRLRGDTWDHYRFSLRRRVCGGKGWARARARLPQPPRIPAGHPFVCGGLSWLWMYIYKCMYINLYIYIYQYAYACYVAWISEGKTRDFSNIVEREEGVRVSEGRRHHF